jgi:lysophospholipase
MLRALAAALIAMALAGCRDEARETFLHSLTPPDLAERYYPPQGWAWGLVQTGDAPPQRYGVGSPQVSPRAQVLILTGRGQPAEVWFETVRDLMAQGATVWVLERAAQGGSGRYAAPRDLIHAPSFDPDVGAVRAMQQVVIRPDGSQPLVILAESDGAAIALRAVETGTQVDGLILSSPRLGTDQDAPAQGLLAQVGFGGLAASGRRTWRRDGPDGVTLGLTHDAWRGRTARSWEIANPDLRVSGESVGWRAALEAAGRAARRDAGRVRTPVLLLSPGGEEDAALCKALSDCRLQVFPGARPALHLESDRFRGPWLAAASGFVARRIGRLSPPLAAASSGGTMGSGTGSKVEAPRNHGL